MKYFFASILFLFLFLFISSKAYSWGGRGHDTICQTAVYLVKNKNLKDFLRNKPNMMGHLCNIPDIYWRSFPADKTKEGNATHYISSELIGVDLKNLPLDFSAIIKNYTGTENKTKTGLKIIDIPYEMGSNWWRANQLFQLSIIEGKKLQDVPIPANSKEEQDDNLSYNKYLYSLLTYMGILGHFVGDNSQPFHNSNDYDGYAAGHGGIHAYYEDASVAYFEADLADLIFKQALVIDKNKTMKKFILEKTTLEKMRSLGALSNAEAKDIFKLDPIVTPSVVKEEKGLIIKTAAVRKSADIGQKKFSKLIVNQMARSSLLLATLWDEIYTEIGKPEFKSYKSYRYPLTPDFVMPDYYELKKVDVK